MPRPALGQGEVELSLPSGAPLWARRRCPYELQEPEEGGLTWAC